MTTVRRWCCSCGAEVLFAQPECHDGHGADCPEWACVQCGEAILVGFADPAPVIVLPSVA